MLLSWAGVPVDQIDDWLLKALRAAIYLAGAGVLTFLLTKLFARIGRLSAEIIRERGGTADAELEKQTTTITDIARRVLLTMGWILALVLALKEYGLDVGPILAGAGVAGLAIGFAAQSVLKDWINGFFLLAEGRIRISDVVKIGELSGVVEFLSLRTTVLRGYDGNVHVFSNGTIQNFTNMTLGHSYALFDVAVEYEEDPQRLVEIFLQVSEELRADEEYASKVLEAVEVAGVDRFTEQGVVVKARIKTQASQQWAVGREFNRRLRALCVERGVAIATAQRAVQIFERGFKEGGMGYGPHAGKPDARA
jgi:small conductance mechanosensitive channel